jgi:hypothetical protein
MFKGTLPIFTSYVRKFDTSGDTSFARNTDDALDSVFAIRRIMAFMHSNTDAFRTWSEQNPTAEIGLESSVVQSAADVEEETSTTEDFEDPAQFIRNAKPAAAAATTTTTVSATSAAIARPSPAEKGPAPPMLSYEFLSRAPKITALVLKR